MWVFIVAKGARGDCQPFAYLAAGLIARGHRVTLAMESHHRGMVEEVVGASALSEGRVELVGLKGDFEDVQRSDAWQHAVRHRLTWLLVRMVEFWLEENYLSDAWEVLQCIRKSKERPAVMIMNPIVWLLALPIAEGLGLPLVVVPLLPPSHPIPEHPPVLMSPKPLALSALNVWAARAALDGISASFTRLLPLLHTLQKEVDAPPLDPYAAMTRLLHLRFATAYPTLLFPRPPSWPHTITCCGALVARSPPPSFLPPPQLQAFLEQAEQDDDQKPVFLSWGPMAGVRPDLARLAVAALRICGRRGVWQRGLDGQSLAHIDAQADADLVEYARTHVVEVEGPVPHTWLFPRCSVIVHHGGAGTTATALYAGVPQVVVPAVVDQPFWAVRVSQAGLGPPFYTSAYDATPESLAAAIRYVSTEHLRVRATVAKVEAMHEDGVANVVEVVESEARRGGKAFWADVHGRVREQHRRRVRRARIALGVVALVAGGVTLLVLRRRRKK